MFGRLDHCLLLCPLEELCHKLSFSQHSRKRLLRLCPELLQRKLLCENLMRAAKLILMHSWCAVGSDISSHSHFSIKKKNHSHVCFFLLHIKPQLPKLWSETEAMTNVSLIVMEKQKPHIDTSGKKKKTPTELFFWVIWVKSYFAILKKKKKDI